MMLSASFLATSFVTLFAFKATTCDAFGCFWFPLPTTGEQAFFPLRSVVLNATVIDSIVEVSVQHEFETTHPLFDITRVTTYELPIDEQGAVTSFRAFIGTRIIEGTVKDKVQARKEFDEAVSNGDSAFLAESESTDVFKLSLGNVPQDELLRVQLIYVAPIEAVTSQKLRFVLPASLAPEVDPWSIASRLPFLNNGATINVQVATPNVISLSSPTHVIDISSGTEGMLSATLLDQEFQSRRDIVFELETSVNPVLQVYSEQTSTSTAFMMTVVPSINVVSVASREYIFVVDRSQSMGQDRPLKVGRALREVLADLEQGALFNVLGFGGFSRFLFREGSRPVSDDDAVQAANQYFDELSNDFGWTDIRGALQAVIDMPVNPIYERNVMLITDAELIDSQIQNVLNFVTGNRGFFRLFTLGVGEEVSRVVINGAARNGGGTADFAFEVNGELNATEVRDALQRQIRVASSPTLAVSNIDWGSNGTQAPFVTPALFSGKRFTLFHIGNNPMLPPAVRLEAEFQGVSNILDAAVYQVGSDNYIQTSGFTKSSTVIHQMAAREMIRDLEEQRSALHLRTGGATDDEIRDEIIRIGVTHQIASTETSFVAIDNEGWTSVSQRELSGDGTGDQSQGQVSAPAPAPAPAPAGGGGGFGSIFCFPGDGIVDVKGKGLVPMRNVQIGDHVGIGQGRGYSRVYSFGHKDDEASNVEYIEIDAHGLSKPLKISSDHMLFVSQETTTSDNHNKAVPSSLVRVGDKIVLDSGNMAVVTSIKTVVGNGAYAPFTFAGVLVVDEVMVSSYVSLLKDEEELTIGGLKTGLLNMHWLAHVFQTPHQMMCVLDWAKCANEKYTDDGKLSEFVAWRYEMAVWYLGIDNVFMEICVNMLLIGFVAMCCGLEMFMKMAEGTFDTGVFAVVGLMLFGGWYMKKDCKKVKDKSG